MVKYADIFTDRISIWDNDTISVFMTQCFGFILFQKLGSAVFRYHFPIMFPQFRIEIG